MQDNEKSVVCFLQFFGFGKDNYYCCKRTATSNQCTCTSLSAQDFRTQQNEIQSSSFTCRFNHFIPKIDKGFVSVYTKNVKIFNFSLQQDLHHTDTFILNILPINPYLFLEDICNWYYNENCIDFIVTSDPRTTTNELSFFSKTPKMT